MHPRTTQYVQPKNRQEQFFSPNRDRELAREANPIAGKPSSDLNSHEEDNGHLIKANFSLMDKYPSLNFAGRVPKEDREAKRKLTINDAQFKVRSMVREGRLTEDRYNRQLKHYNGDVELLDDHIGNALKGNPGKYYSE